MATTIRSMLALTTLFAAGAIHAQVDELNPGLEKAPGQIGVAPLQDGQGNQGEKQKDRILRLLEVTGNLGRWTPNEASFVTVLGGVRDRVVGAKESELAPMSEFMPYLSELTASLARIEKGVGSLQSAAELCDPARRQELFFLYLDALGVGGQLPVHARICEKIAAEHETERGPSQVCIGASLAFFAAQSLHDRIVACDPSLARAPSEVGDGQIERLSAELASVQAGVQDSVRSAKRELTDAMSVVAVHVADVSSGQTKQLEDLTVRLEIERALQQGALYGSLYLPQANGGRLEVVRRIVTETIQNVLNSGETVNGASEKLAAGDIQLKDGHFKEAFRLYCAAYKAAVGPAPKQPASR